MIDDEFDALAKRAREAAENAYAPYSKFRVGAALRADSGIYVGVNIENASYPLGICAERAAYTSAISAGERDFIALAVACIDARIDAPMAHFMPCGACRQWLVEFSPDMQIIVARRGSSPLQFRVDDLLPNAFTLAD